MQDARSVGAPEALRHVDRSGGVEQVTNGAYAKGEPLWVDKLLETADRFAKVKVKTGRRWPASGPCEDEPRVGRKDHNVFRPSFLRTLAQAKASRQQRRSATWMSG